MAYRFDGIGAPPAAPAADGQEQDGEELLARIMSQFFSQQEQLYLLFS